MNAGTVEDHIGRIRELADAGVDDVIVSFVDLGADPPAAGGPSSGSAR